MSIKSDKAKRRKPAQGDYYESIRERDTIDPASGLTWGEKYKRDLRQWEFRNEKPDAEQRAYEFATTVFRSFLRGNEVADPEASAQWFKRRLLGDKYIQAESDTEARCRERAVRALSKACKDNECACDGFVGYCGTRDEFLKHYDNNE